MIDPRVTAKVRCGLAKRGQRKYSKGLMIKEELFAVREEKGVLRGHLAQRDELIRQQQALLAEQNVLI